MAGHGSTLGSTLGSTDTAVSPRGCPLIHNTVEPVYYGHLETS